MRYVVRIATAVFTFAVLCACAGGGSTGAVVTTPGGIGGGAQNAMDHVALGATAVSAALPAVGEITGTIAFGPVATSGIIALAASATAPSGVSALQSRRAQSTSGALTVLEYVSITPQTTISLDSLPAIGLSLPASIPTAGKAFYYGISDPQAQSGLITFDTEGPAHVDGQTVSFPAVAKPLVLAQGHTYTFILYDVESTLHAATRIYVLGSTGSIKTYAGDGTPSTPTLLNTNGVAFTVDRAGKFYVVAGGCADGSCVAVSLVTYNPDGSPSMPTITAGLDSPGGVAVDARGTIYVADRTSIKTFKPDGTPSFSITQAVDIPIDVVVDSVGNIHVLNFGSGTVTTYRPDGTQISPTIQTGLRSVAALAVDAAGKIYVIDGIHQDLRTFSADGSPSVPSFFQLDYPVSVAVDAAGKIYIAIHGYQDPHITHYFIVYNPDGTPGSPIIEMNAGQFIRGIVVR